MANGVSTPFEERPSSSWTEHPPPEWVFDRCGIDLTPEEVGGL